MRFAVYCGSAVGDDEAYKNSAITLAGLLHKYGIGIVYGGGNIGIMGVLADESVRLGNEIIGVIPSILFEREVAHRNLTEIHVVNNMHERKQLMFDLCDAVIALPGGIGTMEELFEAYTWNQIGIHHKPCAALNVNGFYNHLDFLLKHMEESGFLRTSQKDLLKFFTNEEDMIRDLIERIKA